MARHRDEFNEERDYYPRNEHLERERAWNFNDPYRGRTREETEYGRDRFRGRFSERAEHEFDEPRYSGSMGRYAPEGYGRADYGRDYSRRYEQPVRSRLRCRDIMTRDLAVATRDTTLREVALMMKQEDTGVIPVVDYDVTAGNGGGTSDDRRTHHTYGKLVGLITDRDIVIRAVAEDRDCRTARAEEIMSTDIHTARPNDRVVDVIRKMGDRQVRRIPVVNENGYLVGMISMGDIALETEADRELAEALEDISRESSFWSRIFG